MPLHRLACIAAAFATFGLTAPRSTAADEKPLPQNLATVAAAKGETASATDSLERMLTLALALDPTLAQVNGADHWKHSQVASSVESRLNLTRAGLGKVREVTGNLTIDARERVSAALTAVDEAQTKLQVEISNARTIDETGWTDAREALADAFTNYARTVLTAATTADAALTQGPAAN